jgi:hypothetical protein
MNLSEEIALLSLVIERAHGDDESMLLARLEFESLWERYRRATQSIYDRYRAEAREEFEAQISRDLHLVKP